MNPNEIFDAIDRYLRDAMRTPFKDGIVVSIQGQSVMVSIRGQSIVACPKPSGGLSIGDSVVLIKHPRNGQLIIMTSYPTSQIGGGVKESPVIYSPTDLVATTHDSFVIWSWAGKSGASYHVQISPDQTFIAQDIYTSDTQVVYSCSRSMYCRVRTVVASGQSSPYTSWVIGVPSSSPASRMMDNVFSYGRFT